MKQFDKMLRWKNKYLLQKYSILLDTGTSLSTIVNLLLCVQTLS